MPPDSPGPARVLGPRVAAALIDIAVLAGLFALLGLAVGEPAPHPAAPGSFSLHFFWGTWYLTLGQTTLGGWWLTGYLALALLYFFALETMTGQTAGKAVASLRVLRPDGSRPAWGAIAVRTLLRIVDWLPILYLVGFICLLATGQRRQRLGDIAAGTEVVRPLPLARSQAGRAAFVLPLAILAILGLSIQFGPHPGPGTYRAHGVSFRYPTAWRQGTPEAKISSKSQHLLWGAIVGSGPADPVDIVVVQAFGLPIPITAANLQAAIPSIQASTQSGYQQGGGALQAGPGRITMGGLPAVQFQGRLTLAGRAVQSTVTYAFDGPTEYFVNCEMTPAHAAEVKRGCAQILRTFLVG